MSDDKNTPLSAAEFGQMFAHYRPRFTVIARRYVRNEAVAEDIVSDSFMAFWEVARRDDFSSGEINSPAYILTIVRNRCLDWLRAQTLHTKIEQQIYQLHQQLLAADIRSLEAFDPKAIFSDELADIVQRSLDALPGLTREVFIARRFADMSYKEIAEQHSISVRRVEFELEKAMKIMRVALKDYLPVLLPIFLITNKIQ